MRVAIVNDMAMAVEAMRRIVSSRPDYEVAWIARDGAEAVRLCARDRPDMILMDMIMPEVDGVEATRRIMKSTPCPILIVTASVTDHAAMVFQALGEGALDAVSTPVLGFSGTGSGGEELLTKIAVVDKLIRAEHRRSSVVFGGSQRVWVSSQALLAIGASTGGPQALARVLAGLPADFPAPVVIIQHVDKEFAPGLVQWLNDQSPLPVYLAREGDTLERGVVLVAGTNDHLVLKSHDKVGYTREPAAYVYRPSVDVFFESVAQRWPGPVTAVLLTGMGRDGAEGLLHLRKKGMYTISQDQATCAVYGMPKAAAQLAAAVEVLPLGDIAQAVVKNVMMKPH